MKFKRIIAFVLMIAVVFGFSIPTEFVSAKNAKMQNEISLNPTLDVDEIYIQLLELGFSDIEAKDLISKDPNLNSDNNDNKSESLNLAYAKCFPSKPKTGTRCETKFKISNAQLGFPAAGLGTLQITKAEVARRFVSIVGASYVASGLIVAAGIISLYNTASGFSGFNISVQYYYGPDNNQLISWTVGPTTISRYK